jgi:hypothetical protein
MQISRCALSIVTALVLTTGCFIGEAEARTADSESSTIAARVRAPRVVLDHFMVDAANPSLIIPCIKVRRGLFQRSRNDASITVEVTASYTSRGLPVEQTFVMSLSDFHLSDHHPQPKNGKWRLLDATISLGDNLIDAGSTVTGSVTLLSNGGGGDDSDDDDDGHDCAVAPAAVLAPSRFES